MRLFKGKPMFKNYLTVAIRNLLRYKGYSLINVAGLAIGMACCIMVLAFIQDELSFNRFHEKADRIHWVLRETRSGDDARITSGTSAPLAQALESAFPEVEKAVRFWPHDARIRYGEKEFWNRVYMVEPEFFDVFDFPFVKGNKETAFLASDPVLITESVAKQIFGDEDPMGKVVPIQDRTFGGELVVTGVLKDVPKNSTLHFDVLVTRPTSVEGKDIWATWRPTQAYRPVETYVLLKENTDVNVLEQKMAGLMEQYMGAEVAKNNSYYVTPLARVYLHLKEDYGLDWFGDIQQLYLVGAIAFFILMIACINFMSLSTARSANRAREVGLRKVVGAYRKQLIGQFLGESLLLSFMALVVALGFVELALPSFNTFVDKKLTFGVLADEYMILGLVGVALFTGILAGSYPAFFLSAFSPAETVKTVVKKGSGKGVFRKGLVVTQFALSVLLIVSTTVIYQQLDFLRTKNLGYDTEQVAVMPIFAINRWSVSEGEPLLAERYNTVKQAFANHPNVLKVSAFRHYVGWSGGLVRNIIAEGHESETVRMPVLEVDEDFVPLFDMELLAGRNFSVERTSDLTRAYILNETAARQLGWEGDAVGKGFEWVDPESDRKGQVIGVVKDFHYRPLHQKIGPLAMAMRPSQYWNLGVKISGSNVPETMAFLEKTWKQFMLPSQDFTYSFMDDQYQQRYEREVNLSKITTACSGLAIFLACLGLLGLSAYTAEQRRKEVGVRKVLGASVGNLTALLSKEFVWLVIIANVIAWPVVYFVGLEWLKTFAYRIDLGVIPFIIGTLLVLFIALATVSYQAWKAALSNPIDALRCE